jgi:hypothetical protein
VYSRCKGEIASGVLRVGLGTGCRELVEGLKAVIVMNQPIQADTQRQVPLPLTEEVYNRHEFLSLVLPSFKSIILHRIYRPTASYSTFGKEFLLFLQELRVEGN